MSMADSEREHEGKISLTGYQKKARKCYLLIDKRHYIGEVEIKQLQKIKYLSSVVIDERKDDTKI